MKRVRGPTFQQHGDCPRTAIQKKRKEKKKGADEEASPSRAPPVIFSLVLCGLKGLKGPRGDGPLTPNPLIYAAPARALSDRDDRLIGARHQSLTEFTGSMQRWVGGEVRLSRVPRVNDRCQGVLKREPGGSWPTSASAGSRRAPKNQLIPPRKCEAKSCMLEKEGCETLSMFFLFSFFSFTNRITGWLMCVTWGLH